jgi:hypothetical protein
MRTDADSDEEGREDYYDEHEYHESEYDAPEYSAREDDEWYLDDNGAYWRRRFLILCGGAVALGVCAWLFPASHAPARTSPAASASESALAARLSLPPAATGPAWPGPRPTARPSTSPGASASASGTVPGTASAKLAAAAKAGKAAGKAKQKAGLSYHPSKAATGAGQASGSAGQAGSCAASDIVLSLFTSKPGYGGGARPAFSVYAVSTSAKACRLRYGPGSVKVVVTRHGHVVWDSAACHPPAAKRVRFTLGVPQVLTLSWNRKAAGPGGCAGALPAGAVGTLDAVALWGTQSSAVASFKVTR